MRIALAFGFLAASLFANVPCADELVRVPLHPFLKQTLQAERPEIERLSLLGTVVGLRVEGLHRHYPEGRTTTERRRVRGTVTRVAPVTDVPGVYALEVTQDGVPTTYRFSATTSPSFVYLDALGVAESERRRPFEAANAAAIPVPLDLLADAVDTPAVVRDYKARLRAAGTVAFYSDRSAYREFSNFYLGAPIVIDGEIWPTSEHYYQAMKYLESAPNVDQGRPYATANVWAVRAAPTPADAARMGRDRTKPLRPDWESVKDDVMRKALVAKFTQHPDLLVKLLGTGDAPLVEHTERDRYWGDGEDGSGTNRLGTLLVEVRDALRAGLNPGSNTPLYRDILWLAEDLVGRSALRGAVPTDPFAKWVRELTESTLSPALQWGALSRAAGVGRAFTHSSHTPADEWCRFFNGLSAQAREQLVERAVDAAGGSVEARRMKGLNLSPPIRVRLFLRIAARQNGWTAGELAEALPELGLPNDELSQLYLSSLRHHPNTRAIREFPNCLVNDRFVQEVVRVLNEARFPCALHCTQEEADQWRGMVLKDLLESAAAHGLRYRVVYGSNGAPFDPTEGRDDNRGRDTVQLVRQ